MTGGCKGCVIPKSIINCKQNDGKPCPWIEKVHNAQEKYKSNLIELLFKLLGEPCGTNTKNCKNKKVHSLYAQYLKYMRD